MGQTNEFFPGDQETRVKVLCYLLIWLTYYINSLLLVYLKIKYNFFIDMKQMIYNKINSI